MLLLTAFETQSKDPTHVPIANVQLEQLMKGVTIDLDGQPREEARLFEESNTMEWVEGTHFTEGPTQDEAP